MNSKYFPLLCATLVLLTVSSTVSQHSLAITCNSEITFDSSNAWPRRTFAYDGEDSIYIAGFKDTDSIYRFSITQDTLEAVGTSFNYTGQGSGFWHTPSKELYNIGGFNQAGNYLQKDMWHFHPENGGDPVDVGKFPVDLGYSRSLWDGKDGIYIFELGKNMVYEDTLWLYNMTTNVTTLVNTLPFQFSEPVFTDQDTIYRIGGHTGLQFADVIYKYSISTNESERLPVDLPYPIYSSSVVYAGQLIYIIGGAANNGDNATTNVLTFDPKTQQIKEFYVEGLPPNNMYTSSVFVEKLNRIYVLDKKNIYHFEINTEPGSCPPSGLHKVPHSVYCRKYTICCGGNASNEKCSLGLLFNSLTSECDFPQNVECAKPTCPGEGLVKIPHEESCNKFYFCVDGTSSEQICPEGLLFNPDISDCDRPDNSECE